MFDEHLDGFDPGLLRFSAAFGLSTSQWNPPVQFLVGLGSETFDHGAQIDSVRLLFGIPRSF